jgi:hypothetical protein
MFTYFYPLFLLQGFCLYHAYKSRTDQKWYWMIIFFPYVGCLLYLYDAFYSRRTVSNLTEGIKQVVNSNYKIERLEREVKFSNNNKNKIDLADAYLENGRPADAVILFEDCMQGYMADDETLKKKLLHALFLDGKYERCIPLGRGLLNTKSFKNSLERISFAQALYHDGNTEEAVKHFEEMDRPFTNYEHRYAFCQFLINTGKNSEAQEKLDELTSEIDLMKGVERKTHREIIRQIKYLKQATADK